MIHTLHGTYEGLITTYFQSYHERIQVLFFQFFFFAFSLKENFWTMPFKTVY